MNVLKPHLQTTIKTLLARGVSQRAINRNTGVDRKTIRKYGRLHDLGPSKGEEDSKSPTHEQVATGSGEQSVQNPPSRPPGFEEDSNQLVRSACEPHRQWIEEQLQLGRNATAIYQDLVEQFAFDSRYNSVKRFVRKLKRKQPKQYDRLEYLMGEEAQVDYGQGAPTIYKNGKYRRPRLFIMTLKYSGRAFRKVVWKSSQEIWAKLHEEAFRYFGGCPQYVTLDNLKEGVIKPDIYDPELNSVYAAMLEHYGVAADPARVLDSNRKGTVENAVKHTQNTALKGRKFDSIELQNEWLMYWEDRWAATRIHGRAKRQVEKMYQEEKPYLSELPLRPFRYFSQETRTVYDDGTIQIGNSYYAARPADLYSEVVVRIYDEEIEILDPVRMEVIRRHPKSKRPGSLMMEPKDRIFNPSKQTDRLLAQAELIGPNTFSLCNQWFREEGRAGQRRMYGLTNLVRHYPAVYIEKVSKLAEENGLRSSRALRRMVESMTAEAEEKKSEESKNLTQEHPLIRSGDDYAAFWNRYASVATQAEPSKNNDDSKTQTVSYKHLSQVWKNAGWVRVIEVFGLTVDDRRRSRDDELWVRSPFTQEDKASMHVSLSENIYKDFSSGNGGGIMQFCRDMLAKQGRKMTMLEVAQWMLDQGVSRVDGQGLKFEKNNQQPTEKSAQAPLQHTNPSIEIDLRGYLHTNHPELERRGISAATCNYLGCGYLPQREKTNRSSPLNLRLVFQIRGLKENGNHLQPIIISHMGRALSRDQEETDGKYWGYPFRKSLEIYNQDKLLLDERAARQAVEFGLILVEGFFDVAKLVQAGCLNVCALMGASISENQIERLAWIRSKINFPRILLFLDRDRAGREGCVQIHRRLSQHMEVSIFDWEQSIAWQGKSSEPIPVNIQDPADMPIEQLGCLRGMKII